jgi:hypothetical protein
MTIGGPPLVQIRGPTVTDGTQLPPAQTRFDAVQSFPHVPQFSLSFQRSTQSWPHFMIWLPVPFVGVVQPEEQTPAEQASPAAQARPQAPQLFGSTLVFRHVPLHSVW